MSAPVQMTSQRLNALKGWPRPHAVDFTSKLDASVATRVQAGSVVYLSAAKTFKLGVGNTNRMPMFLLWPSDSLNVTNNGGNPATDKRGWVPIVPVGDNAALVAIGAYELVSTNYDPSPTYNPNDFLTSPDSGGNAGWITKGVLGTNMICGVVSRGVVDNGYGFNAIAFWPVMLPVYP